MSKRNSYCGAKACGATPIKPGMIISWVFGPHHTLPKVRRGKVVSVESNYQGFVYRVQTLSVRGKPIGFATVHDSQAPEIEMKSKHVAKPTKRAKRATNPIQAAGGTQKSP